MRLNSLLLLLVFTGSICACAQIPHRDCHTTDWFSLGQRDGLVGAPVEVFETYLETCRGAEIPPDREAYQKGRQDGLQYYCTDANGFRTGRARRPYHHVCPPALEKYYLTGRARGMLLEGCRAETYVFDQHLLSIERALQAREQALEAPDTPPATLTRLRAEIEALKVTYRQAVDDMDAMEQRCLEQQ